MMCIYNAFVCNAFNPTITHAKQLLTSATVYFQWFGLHMLQVLGCQRIRPLYNKNLLVIKDVEASHKSHLSNYRPGLRRVAKDLLDPVLS